MRRITILGSCLVAMLALGAVSASSAFAGSYEYGICAKASPKKSGQYTEKNCLQESAHHEGKYSWFAYPGPAGTSENEWEFTDKSETSTLKSSVGTFTCKKDKSVGKVTGATTSEDEITLEECSNNTFGTNCYNVEATKEGKKGGTIVVGPVSDELISHGEQGMSGQEPAEGEVWTEYFAKAPDPDLTVYYCKTPLGEDPFSIHGSLSGVTTPTDISEDKFRVEFGEGKGEQDLIANTYNEAKEEVQLPLVLTGSEGVKQGSHVEIRG